MPQMAEKTSPDAPPNCAAVPYSRFSWNWFISTPKMEKSPFCAWKSLRFAQTLTG